MCRNMAEIEEGDQEMQSLAVGLELLVQGVFQSLAELGSKSLWLRSGLMSSGYSFCSVLDMLIRDDSSGMAV